MSLNLSKKNAKMYVAIMNMLPKFHFYKSKLNTSPTTDFNDGRDDKESCLHPTPRPLVLLRQSIYKIVIILMNGNLGHVRHFFLHMFTNYLL